MSLRHKPRHIPSATIDDVRIDRSSDMTFIGMYHHTYEFNGAGCWSIVRWGDHCKIGR